MAVLARTGRLSSLAVLAALLAAGCATARATGSAPPARPAPPAPPPPSAATPSRAPRPNIVLIVTDDLDAGSMVHLKRVKSLLADPGTSFSRFFVTDSECCPSRASILTGQYPHNHGVHSNNPPLGGFVKFRQTGRESSTVATWLKDAGYHTALVGKYLNGYPAGEPTYVPPGWDDWHAVFSDRGSDAYFDYSTNDNGTVNEHGHEPADYDAEVLAERSVEIIRRVTARSQPLFLYVATAAPHIQAVPPPRYQEALPGLTAPRPPSFDEEDMSDKPGWLRNQPHLVPREIRQVDRLYRQRVQTMLAVEDLIERVLEALRAAGQLDNTYVFFTSDNGFFFGEHRFAHGKGAPYEESIRVPLVARGPGIPAGRQVDQLVLNIDFAPTFAALARARTPETVDGRSLVPLLQPTPPAEWRKDFLVEYWALDAEGIPEFTALRTADRLYAEYTNGDRELYDLRQDPYELQNLLAGAEPPEAATLATRLHALKTCRGAECRR